jgi:hypothetical protein
MTEIEKNMFVVFPDGKADALFVDAYGNGVVDQRILGDAPVCSDSAAKFIF